MKQAEWQTQQQLLPLKPSLENSKHAAHLYFEISP